MIKRNYTLYLLLEPMENLKKERINRSELINKFLLDMEAPTEKIFKKRIQELENQLKELKAKKEGKNGTVRINV